MNKPQNVLITGSSSGFGLGITRTLVANGYTVFATMREPNGRNLERVPQYHIASYLGITEVSLSRLKRSLRQTHQYNGVHKHMTL